MQIMFIQHKPSLRSPSLYTAPAENILIDSFILPYRMVKSGLNPYRNGHWGSRLRFQNLWPFRVVFTQAWELTLAV